MSKNQKLVQRENVQRTGYMAATCPYYGKDIFIPNYKPVPIMEEEFRKRVQNEMKAAKHNRNV